MPAFQPMLSAVLVIALAGCTHPSELKTYFKGSMVDTGIVKGATANGATSCRYNLEDLLIHALGSGRADGISIYPVGDTERRPFAGTYVTTYNNGDKSHLQIVVGKDASGFCSLYWSETRLWKTSCKKVTAMYSDSPNRRASNIGISVLLSGEKSVTVLLTPLSGSSCLVTESDIAWRIDPDEAVRQWIKDDHGYDPAGEHK